MSVAQSWLAAVVQAGGDREPPPDPIIPSNYLRSPQRQHPAFAHPELSPPPHLPLQPKAISRPNRKRAALAEIPSPNELHPNKRQRIPNESKIACAMSERPKSPLKLSRTRSRTASRTAGETYTDAQPVGYVADPNATPRPGRVRHKPAPASAPPLPALALRNTAVPEWNSAPGASDSDYTDKEDPNRPMSSVTKSTDSKARSRSPTKRMIDLKVADKTVSSRTARSLADVPEDVRKLYKEIQSLARVPRGVVPRGIEVRGLISHNSFSLTFTLGSAPSRCW